MACFALPALLLVFSEMDLVLIDKINDREVYMKGIDHSYYYESNTNFKKA